MSIFKFFQKSRRHGVEASVHAAILADNQRLIAENLGLIQKTNEAHLLLAEAGEALTVIDDAWAASPYPGNRKHLSLAEQMAALDTELEGQRDEIARLRAAVANAEMDGPKRTLEKANDAQAARAMSRNTKQAFQVYQGAVRIILDRLDGLAKGNHVTKEDIRKLRQLRVDLGEQIGRSI